MRQSNNKGSRTTKHSYKPSNKESKSECCVVSRQSNPFIRKRPWSIDTPSLQHPPVKGTSIATSYVLGASQEIATVHGANTNPSTIPFVLHTPEFIWGWTSDRRRYMAVGCLAGCMLLDWVEAPFVFGIGKAHSVPKGFAIRPFKKGDVLVPYTGQPTGNRHMLKTQHRQDWAHFYRIGK